MPANPLKYARIERERNFLLAPDQNLMENLSFKTITDHYINGTYLRLRKITGDSDTDYKLTKKTPGDSSDKTIITNIYLTEHEYGLLNKFDSIRVDKIRFIKEVDNIRIAIDKYLTGNDELWLAEIEFKSDEEMRTFKMPLNYTKEVTDDPNFNGYQLAKRFGTKIAGHN
jgi:CYTH domain-containing protein